MKRILCALLAFLMLFGGARSASATPPTVAHWNSGWQAGVLLTDIECPIEVEHMLLTFDLQSFAHPHINTKEELDVYTGKVTARYTFYNPTDSAIVTNLLFYTGYRESYPYFDTIAHKYEILIDGEAVEKTLCTPENIPVRSDSYPYEYSLWYEYEITVAPGQRVVNTVTSPIYPTVHILYEPYIYEYSYHPVPGYAWNSFGTLDVEINTPYHMLSDSGFTTMEKTETGYKASIPQDADGISSQVYLNFVLSTVENPAEVEPDNFNWGILLILVMPFLVIAQGIKGLFNIIGDAFQMLIGLFQ